MREPDRLRSWAVPGLLLIVALALTVAATWQPLNGDVQYVIGGQLVARGPDGQPSGIDTFTHRPLVYRTFATILTSAAGLIGQSPVQEAPFEIVVRLLGAVVGWAASAALSAALRPRLPHAAGWAISIAVGAALNLAPTWDFLQAEWLGSVLTVLGIAAALGSRSRIAGGLFGGVLLALAAAAKLSTAPYAAIGFVVVLALDRRRGADVLIGGIMAGLALAGLLLVVPDELQWMRDTAVLSAGSPIETLLDWRLMSSALASKATVSPVLLLVPGALVLLARLGPPGGRLRIVALALVALALGAVPLVLQREGYLYRLTILPVIGAAIVAGAASLLPRLGRRAWWLVATAILAGCGASVLLALPEDLRNRRILYLIIALAGAAIAVAAVAWYATRSSSVSAASDSSDARPGARLVPGVLGAVVLVALALPALSPTSAWSLDPRRTHSTNGSWASGVAAAQASLADLSAAIGSDESVLYLAYGSVAYHMGNPTPCRYPSPVFLRLARQVAGVANTPSYAATLACFTDGRAAWLVVQPGWMSVDQLPEAARTAVQARYDCDRARTSASGVIACPSRAGS